MYIDPHDEMEELQKQRKKAFEMLFAKNTNFEHPVKSLPTKQIVEPIEPLSDAEKILPRLKKIMK